jgi:hypothetical protein
VIQKVTYKDVPDCIELSNGTAAVILATTFGPRILSYSLDDGENILGWHPEAAVQTPLGTWRPHGGHRLWIAPENMPRSYAPDDIPVDAVSDGELSVILKGAVDAAGVQKEMAVTLAASGSEVTIDHRLTVTDPCTAAAWALTIMRPGGTVVIPNEPFAPYSPEHLLPVRSMALWSYTDFTDPRWEFTKDAIRLRIDESLPHQQKLGILNKQGWAGYELNDVVFRKATTFIDAVYPDMNSNFEFYTAGDFVEIETLSPLTSLDADATIEHVERWSLDRHE